MVILGEGRPERGVNQSSLRRLLRLMDNDEFGGVGTSSGCGDPSPRHGKVWLCAESATY